MIGFMLDSARSLDQRPYQKRFIDFIAERGADTLLWHFSDDQGCAIRFEACPECASPNAYSTVEVAELAAYARSRGVTLVPELASLGHTRYLTRGGDSPYRALAETDDYFSSISPVSPQTRQLIGSLLDEVVKTFNSPVVHVGLDEVNLGGHPLTRQALQTQAETALFADYVCFLHARLTSHGRRMMMWADYVVKHPRVAEQLPRDILMANWQYDPATTPDATRQLAEQGFDVVVCPALISHNQPVVAGESFAYPNVRKMSSYRSISSRVVGTITTIWTPTRFLSDTLWPAMDFAAAVMRDGEAVDVERQAADFGRTFFGLPDTAKFSAAMRRLAQVAPLRATWLPILRLEKPSLASDEMLNIFSEIAGDLRACATKVDRNQEAYGQQLLLCDLFQHAWERAVAVRDGRVTEALLNVSRRTEERLLAAWDRDRFSNDPRRLAPESAFDEDDHLFLVFTMGTRVLKSILDVPLPGTQKCVGTGATADV